MLITVCKDEVGFWDVCVDVVWEDAGVDEPVVDETGVDDAVADGLDINNSNVDDTKSVVEEVSDFSEEVTEGVLLATELCSTDAEVGGEVLDSIDIVDE